MDGAPVGDDGYSVQYVYTNNAGTVDVHTLRSVIYNPDGSYDTMGDLIGVAAKGDQGYGLFRWKETPSTHRPCQA